MWVFIAALGTWVFLRKRAGLPLLPAFLSDPFAKGGILVHTAQGAVIVPADTPAKTIPQGLDVPIVNAPIVSTHPTSSPLISAGTSAGNYAPIASSPVPGPGPVASAYYAAGNFVPFDYLQAAGSPNYEIDEYGMPRASTLSRPWWAR